MYQFVQYEMARSIQQERRQEAERIAVARRFRLTGRAERTEAPPGSVPVVDAAPEAPALAFAPRPSSETRLRRSA